MSAKDQVKTLEKAITILTCLAESQDQLALKDLTDKTGFKTTTCYRLIKAMESMGLLERDLGSKKYRLGAKLISLGVSALGGLNLRQIALPLMTELRDDTGETTNLSVLDGAEILYIERIQSEYLFNVNLSVGSRLPLYCTSQGKAILAFLPEDQAEELIEKITFVKRTNKTLTNVRSLKKELAVVRKKGFAVSNEELEQGHCAVAAPIFNHEAYPIAAINVSYAIARHKEPETMDRFAKKVIDTSQRISRSLGY